MTLKKQILNSSVLEYCQYNPKQQALEIGFLTGKIVQYQKVPSYIYDELVSLKRNRGMAGSYFYRNVRGKYRYVVKQDN